MIDFRDVKSLIIGGLPAGYKKVEYIESTGTQYVDTGFMPDQDTKVVMDVQSVGVVTEYPSQSFFGVRNSADGNERRFAAFWSRTNNAYYIYYSKASKNVASDRLTERMTVTMDKNNLYIGDSVHCNVDYANFDCGISMFLFAINWNGNARYYGANRLYSCQVYDNDVLSRDFVPCINPDNEVGLYDLVTEQFYGNGGTGVFTAGNVVGGVVTQIADASGRVLWKSGPSIVAKTVKIYPSSYEAGDYDLPERFEDAGDYCADVSDNNDDTGIGEYYAYGADITYTLLCPSLCSRVTHAFINARAYLGVPQTGYYAYPGDVTCTITGVVAADGSVVEVWDEHICDDGDNSMALSDTILTEINSRGGVSAFVINVYLCAAEWDSDEEGGATYQDSSVLTELSMTVTGDFYEE